MTVYGQQDKYGRTIDTGNIASKIGMLQDTANAKGRQIQTENYDLGTWESGTAMSPSRVGQTRANNDARSQALTRNSPEWQAMEDAKRRSVEDPWSFYRASSADKLARTANNDPSEKYMSRLERLQSGEFGTGDTSYDWRFQQGQKALERSQASRGLLGSGNAAHELQDYGQGAASQEYAAEFARTLQGLDSVSTAYDKSQSRLMQMAGVGVDPGAMAGRQAGITQSQIGAAASMSNSATAARTAGNRLGEERRQFNVQAEQNAAYQGGLEEMANNYDWSFD